MTPSGSAGGARRGRARVRFAGGASRRPAGGPPATPSRLDRQPVEVHPSLTSSQSSRVIAYITRSPSSPSPSKYRRSTPSLTNPTPSSARRSDVVRIGLRLDAPRLLIAEKEVRQLPLRLPPEPAPAVGGVEDRDPEAEHPVGEHRRGVPHLRLPDHAIVHDDREPIEVGTRLVVDDRAHLGVVVHRGSLGNPPSMIGSSIQRRTTS